MYLPVSGTGGGQGGGYSDAGEIEADGGGIEGAGKKCSGM